MELQLKNIGMIKEANVKIDGLTVIAGENDTGKSTVGKALYLQLKIISHQNKSIILKVEDENDFVEDEDYFIEEIFHGNISDKGTISLSDEKNDWTNKFVRNKFFGASYSKFFKFTQPIMIETPMIWHFMETFSSLSRVERRYNIHIQTPFIMEELDYYLNIPRKRARGSSILLSQRISSIIGGRLQQDSKGNFFFNKNDKEIKLINTATGIKTFGILQVLSENHYLNSKTILILDEPEVHLHPKWQLEMAKIIVELVKNGVKIVVNSHSPYMIEALKRYSEVERIEDKTNFYLAENGYIKQIENSNSLTLEQIFEKLSEPFDVFDKMDSERLQNG